MYTYVFIYVVTIHNEAMCIYMYTDVRYDSCRGLAAGLVASAAFVAPSSTSSRAERQLRGGRGFRLSDTHRITGSRYLILEILFFVIISIIITPGP